MADVRQQRLERFDSAEQPGADVRVLAHLAYLVARQWTGLPHHSVAQADLADVVYESSDRGLDGALLVPANFARQELSVARDATAVTDLARILRFDRAH